MKWQLNHDQLAHTGFLIAALRGYVAASCLIAACAVSLPAQSALAQASPFGDAPPTSTDDESADAVSDETPQFDKLVAAETDPLVLMVLETRPETPQEWIQDIRTLLNLKCPEFAKEYLAQFLADEISDDQLAMIQARFGTALFSASSERTGDPTRGDAGRRTSHESGPCTDPERAASGIVGRAAE